MKPVYAEDLIKPNICVLSCMVEKQDSLTPVKGIPGTG